MLRGPALFRKGMAQAFFFGQPVFEQPALLAEREVLWQWPPEERWTGKGETVTWQLSRQKRWDWQNAACECSEANLVSQLSGRITGSGGLFCRLNDGKHARQQRR